jgi:hypothetical protein
VSRPVALGRGGRRGHARPRGGDPALGQAAWREGGNH